jgi:hypothetical protein
MLCSQLCGHTTQPLALLQPPDAPWSLYLLNHRVWIPLISQADSGEYSCCMDNIFTVAGLLLNALHLPECEEAAFELGIRVVMKRHNKNRVRQWDSNA